LVFRDSGSPATTRTNDWTFTVLNSLPKALLKVTGVDGPPYTPTPNASDLAAKARLEALGFDVVLSGQRRTDVREADGKAIIVISSTVAPSLVRRVRSDSVVPQFPVQLVASDFAMPRPASGGLQ